MTSATTAAIVWDEALTAYDFGASHPMHPIRLELTALLADSFRLFDGALILDAPIAPRGELERIHDPAFLDALAAASLPMAAPGGGSAAPSRPGAPSRAGAPTRPDASTLNRWGLATPEVPVFEGMADASARLVGGSLNAIRAILDGRTRRAVHFAGGMHHAKHAFAGGFCVLNDIVAAIRTALAEGEQRIVYLDLDVHHGDGVEQAFWNDPRVTTISIHQTGQSLYPGTGFIQDTGGPNAAGHAINIPVPEGTRPEDWLRLLDAIVFPLIRAIRPTLLVTQHGADTHRIDPLADLNLTIEAQRAAMLMCRDIAEEAAGGRWLALGGGGYSVADVVPRSWTHLVAVVQDKALDATAPIDTDVLTQIRTRAAEAGVAEPRDFTTMGDGEAADFTPWEAGFNPEHPVDRLALSVRRAHFPEWGLDPFLD